MLSNQKMSTELPLLRTKISVPPIPPEFVRRPRLTDRVNRGVKGPLTLLSAPAGFGKTNLLVEWTAETQLSVAWLMLDDEDNDLGRFFRYLINAFQAVESGLGEDVFVSAIAARLALQRNDLATAAQFRRPGLSRQKGRRSRAFK